MFGSFKAETKLFFAYRGRYHSKAELLFLRPLKNIRKLNLTLEAIQHGMGFEIARLTGLQHIWLILSPEVDATNLAQFAQVSARGWQHLSGLPELRELYLNGSAVGGGGAMRHSAPLQRLTLLELNNTRATDADLTSCKSVD